MNLLNIIGMMKGGNPQQIAMNLIQQNMGNNPMAGNLMGMIKNNDAKGVEQMARNLAKNRGIDVDQAIQAISQEFGAR